jgi:D-aminopeptidase
MDAVRGPKNSLTDVPGVRVGHVTLIAGEGPAAVRTGVTAIVPDPAVFARKLAAGVHVINGFGKMTGLAQVAELGRLETPIALTNTLSVWPVADAVVSYVLARHPDARSVNPVVGECNDGYLNDIRGRHVRSEHALAALVGASDAPVAEGAVGAGTGMVCYGWKGGIGSASRTWAAEPLGGRSVTLGALVLANFGRRQELRVGGCPVGRLLPAEPPPPPPAVGDGGSVVVVLATDAPLTSRQLARVARRAAAGLARTGSVYAHGSGDFALAFSTAAAYPPFLADEGELLNPFFAAAADAVEEAVLRALFAAETMVGRDGHRVLALPRAQVQRLCRAWHAQQAARGG